MTQHSALSTPHLSSPPLAWVVLGVSGSGKSTVGRALATALDCNFIEGDRAHSRENIAKMFHRTPLTDADRRGWLKALQTDIRNAVKSGQEIVVSCSGLKVAYRKFLAAPGRVQFVLVELPEAELRRRLLKRKDHYFKVSMLGSQLASFEPIQADEPAIKVDGTKLAHEIVDHVLAIAKKRWPAMRKTWWRRFVGEELLKK